MFTLDLAYDEFSVDIDQTPGLVRHYQIVGEILELAHPRFQGGFFIGRSLIETNSPLISDGRDQTGYTGGIRLKTMILDEAKFKWGADVIYSYQTTDHPSSFPYYSWHSAKAQSAIGLAPTDYLMLYIGGGAAAYRGRFISLEKQTFTWRRDPHMLFFAGIDAQLDPGGHIGVEIHLSEIKGISFYFQRRF